jgi:hypothetical protein
MLESLNQLLQHEHRAGDRRVVGPSLATFSGKLYAAWKGEGNDQGIYYASFSGSSWSSQAQIPNVGSSEGPSLAVFNDKLYAMWKGEGNDQGIYYASFSGSSWSSQAQIPGNTGQDLPVNIGVNMQYQLMKEWCWIAVTTSVSKFYNAASTWTQCSVLTAQLNKTGQVAKPGTCCSPLARYDHRGDRRGTPRSRGHRVDWARWRTTLRRDRRGPQRPAVHLRPDFWRIGVPVRAVSRRLPRRRYVAEYLPDER